MTKSSEVAAVRHDVLVSRLIAYMLQGHSLKSAAALANTNYTTARSLMQDPEHAAAFRELAARLRRELVDETLDRLAVLNRLGLDRVEAILLDSKTKPADLIKLMKTLWDRSGLPAERVVRHGVADYEQQSLAEIVTTLPEALDALKALGGADFIDVEAIDIPTAEEIGADPLAALERVAGSLGPVVDAPAAAPPDDDEPLSSDAGVSKAPKPKRARKRPAAARARRAKGPGGVAVRSPGEKDPHPPRTAQSHTTDGKTSVSKAKPRKRRPRKRRKP